jgi:histidinol-phosphate aminotransferase
VREPSPAARKPGVGRPAARKNTPRLSPRPGILKIAPYVGGDSELPGIAQPIKLASNESALGPSPRVIKAFQDCAGKLHRYPDGSHKTLREAIAGRYGVEAASIVCGNGSDELLTLLAKAYAGEGDEILYTEHGFLIYPIAALAAGATPRTVPEKNLRADVDAILSAVTPRSRIVYLANPNNPTGTYLTKDELRRLRAGLPDDVLLVIDGAYAEFVTATDYSDGAELVMQGDNVVMTRTFSKIYALAALRLGWALCPPSVVDVLNRLRGPFNLNSAALAAGVAALEDRAAFDAALAHNNQWREWLASELTRLGLQVYPSVANFMLVRFGSDPKRGSAAADRFLRSEGIILRRVDNYGLPECLRVTVGREEEMRKLVASLGKFLAR